MSKIYAISSFEIGKLSESVLFTGVLVHFWDE